MAAQATNPIVEIIDSDEEHVWFPGLNRLYRSQQADAEDRRED